MQKHSGASKRRNKNAKRLQVKRETKPHGIQNGHFQVEPGHSEAGSHNVRAQLSKITVNTTSMAETEREGGKNVSEHRELKQPGAGRVGRTTKLKKIMCNSCL